MAEEKQEYINASQAHKQLIKAGFEMSYPTAIKWLLEEGLATQPLGKQGNIMVDTKKLNEKISGCKHGLKKAERNCLDCLDLDECIAGKAKGRK